ncbi:MAG: amidohydrolase [Betaproteobacteria bacterium]|nr:amidohydrolase [Betaproteobacteria bacterium]
MTDARTLNQWDCHAHLFGPYDEYPLAADRAYTPPEARVQQYLALLKELDIQNGVLVHPSAYGDDHSLLLHTLQEHPCLRGVVVSGPHSNLNLKGLHAKGIRAARFSQRSGAGMNFLGSASVSDFERLQSTLANENLHAEFWTDCDAIAEIENHILKSPVPVVIDHMGGFNPSSGINEPRFQRMLRLLDSGHVWIKLCAYRNLLNEADWEIGKPFMQAMIKQNPDRLVWGSDWPHLRVTPTPQTSTLLAQFKSWCPDTSALEKILRINPFNLYA